jgi:hypothetical protein
MALDSLSAPSASGIINSTNSINSLRGRAQREARMTDKKIQGIDVKIEAKEKLITLKQDQVIASKEFIGKCDEEIAIIKELIDIRKQQVANEIGIKQKKLDLLKESRDLTKESRDLTKESRDLTKESRDLLQKMIEVLEKLIGTIERLMTINPAKYGSLENAELQKLPEIKEVKSNIVTVASAKVEQYPKEEHVALTDTVKNVVDATFTEIKPADMKSNRKLFNNLGKRIEAALDKKHETLASKDKDIRQIMNIYYYKPLESFARVNKLAYLDLAMKDIKA